MKILKRIIMVVAVIVAIPLVTALFIQKSYSVERETIIESPKAKVFDYIKLLKNQDYYNKWVMADPNMKKEFKGTDGTVGFVYSWDGNSEAGKGEQAIKNIIEGERIEHEIHFIEPMEGIGYTYMATEEVAEKQTKVKWGMRGESKYPLNFMNLFIDSILGKDLEISLANLKGNLEK